MRTTIFLLTALTAACSNTTMPEPTASTAQAVQSNTTTIRVNGASASVLLVDSDGTNGFLTVTEDEVAGTVALDFSYATPDPDEPDFADLYQGAGEIPSSAVTLTDSSAHLSLTTPPPFVTHCRVDLVNGTFVCEEAAPLTFDLSWEQNGFGSIHEVTRREETLGPVTTKLRAEFTTVTATVSGTWGGHTSSSLSGDLTDSQSRTYIREIVTLF